jgi:HD-like signal output (HDOD) protein
VTGEAIALLERHERLPARAGAAAQVLKIVDDPDTSTARLSSAIGADPLFAAKLLRVANSSYYGLGGRVGTLPFAVSVVGFQTVRSLAVAAAAGLDDPGAAPAGFWRGAATTATAAELVAPMLGAAPGDAFSLGLLHTLGAALLHQHAPLPALCLPEILSPTDLATAELAAYGITHEHAGARVLGSWHVPETVCQLIARHHEPVLPDAPPLERTLHTARALTDRLLRGEAATLGTDAHIAWLTEGRLTPDDLEPLIARIAERSQGLLDGLQVSG